MKNTEETIQVSGSTEHRIYDADGRLVSSFEEHNVVVNLAKALIANLLAGGSTDKITKIGFGTNGTAAVATDTTLTGSTVKNVDSYTADATGVTFYWSLSTSELNGMTIQERGLVTAAGTLFARKAHDPIVKNSGMSIQGSWRINI